ncbi:Arc family DNA-binding protein [Pseudaminobacter salicylatoxidans]|uniref:Arc family DNA-binding protein n=1 Tax=Pseudaminobacter salicylatoxidans TaxID=93369 RepID=UPI000D6BE364|nr:Arc family DNA-binding protein [Pseudaminobacter salicylatoxidans]
MAKPGRGADQFPLRLPPGMRDQIKRAAEDSGRSMNSEILDVLREAFPEEPSLDELTDALDYATALLRDLQANSQSGDVTRSSKFLTVLGRVEATNDELWKSISKERIPAAVLLRPDVVERLAALQKEYDLAIGLLDGIANDLILMSLERISSGEENLKVWVGEGNGRRMLEIKPPDRRD